MQGILKHMTEDRALEALVRSSVDGDEQSLRDLSKSVSRPLLPFLVSRLARREDALDALQDTLVDLWKALPRFSYTSDAAFFRFVFTIARRKLSRIRQMRMREEPLDDTHDVADMTAAATPEERAVIERALGKLSEKDRDIVVLRYWSGLQFSAIASVMQMREGAVRVRHHRALTELEGILKPYVQ